MKFCNISFVYVYACLCSVCARVCADAHSCVCKGQWRPVSPVLPFPTISPWDKLFTQLGAGLVVSRPRQFPFFCPPHWLGWPACKPQEFLCPGLPSVGFQVCTTTFKFSQGSKETEVRYFHYKQYTNCTVFPAPSFFILIFAFICGAKLNI